jgi:signal transduction histidine kinase
VLDNGYGINQANQQKLFKLFGYLIETENINTQGIGLGLYITKMIVTEFGGEVSVDSEVGKGSTFCLTFEISK